MNEDRKEFLEIQRKIEIVLNFGEKYMLFRVIVPPLTL